jgi:uncharacterized protein YggE
MDSILRVTASARDTILATAALLHIKVDGERAVFGNAALEQAKELRELTAKLIALGLHSDAIRVESVRTASEGQLLRNTRAVFELSIRETDHARIPKVIGTIAEAKNTQLHWVEWVWDEFEASIPLAAEAMRKARRKADVMAQAAGLRVTGIRSASDSWSMPEVQHVAYAMASATPRSKMASAEAVDPGIEYRAERSIDVTVTVDFLLA